MQIRMHKRSLFAGTFLCFTLVGSQVWSQTASQGTDSGSDATALEKLVVSTSENAEDSHAGAADRSQSNYISRDDLAITDPQNLKEVFAGDAAVSVGGGMTTTQKVYVNSIDELNLAVSVDGVQQNNRVFHHHTTNYVDPTLLKSVRVDPGVAPADAGPGALLGALDQPAGDGDGVQLDSIPIFFLRVGLYGREKKYHCSRKTAPHSVVHRQNPQISIIILIIIPVCGGEIIEI